MYECKKADLLDVLKSMRGLQAFGVQSVTDYKCLPGATGMIEGRCGRTTMRQFRDAGGWMDYARTMGGSSDVGGGLVVDNWRGLASEA